MENVKKKVLALVLGFCCAWQMAWGTVLAAAEKEAGKTGIPALVYDGDPGSDDALALFIHKVSGWRLSRAYLISDLTVLALSLTYIPFKKIFFSLITVTISSYILEAVQGKKKEQEGTEGVRA